MVARRGCIEKSTREAGHAVILPWYNLPVFGDLLSTCLLPQWALCLFCHLLYMPYSILMLALVCLGSSVSVTLGLASDPAKVVWVLPKASRSWRIPLYCHAHSLVVSHQPHSIPSVNELSLTPSLPWTRLLQQPWGFSSLPLLVFWDLSPASSGEKQCSGSPLTWKPMFEMQKIPRSAVTLVSCYISFIFYLVFWCPALFRALQTSASSTLHPFPVIRSNR